MEKTEYLWRFLPFGDMKKDKQYRTEVLYSHSIISMAQLDGALYPDMVLEYERTNHRRAVADKIAAALYDGWLPYDVQWWEGEYNDMGILRDFPVERTPSYHFWTKIWVACRAYAIPKRNADINEVSILRYDPESIT